MFLKNSESPRLNGLLIVYIGMAVLCVIVDYFKLAEYYIVKQSNVFHLELSAAKQLYAILAVLLSIGLLITFTVAIRKNYKQLFDFIHFPKLDICDWGVILFLFAITLLRLPFPDYSWDVQAYHLFLQDFKFENNITYNFFPGSSNSFLFPLGDRLLYVSRLLLGYRGGVLLNTLVLILLYFQLKDIIKLFPVMKTAKYKGVLLGLSALSIVSTEALFANIGIYMIDLLMAPFLVELLRMVIVKETISPKFALVYSSLMVGLSIAIKLTSIIFCAWIFAIIIYRYYRGNSFKTMIISLLVLIFPFACYAVYNFTQTHNPVFPLFNEFFKSPYFPEREFNTGLWVSGPKTLFEFLFWPLYMFFQPQRQFWIFPLDSGRVGLGFIVAIAYLGVGLLKKKPIIISISLLVIGSFYTWIYFLNGEKRYGLIYEIVSGILIIGFLCNLFDMDKKIFKLKMKAFHSLLGRYRDRRQGFQRWSKLVYNLELKGVFVRFLAVLTIMAVLSQVTYAYYLSIITNTYDYSQRDRTMSIPQVYIQQMNMIGKDYLPINYSADNKIKEIINEIDVWVLLPVNLDIGQGPVWGYAKLLNNDIPILNLGYVPTAPASLNAFISLEQKTNLHTKNMYTLSILPMDILEKEAVRNGLKVISVFEIQPTFTHFPLKLVKVELK